MKMKNYWYYINEQKLFEDMTEAEERAFEWEQEVKKEEMKMYRKEKRNEKHNIYNI